ncbi:uncharacterized protein PRCAT00002536001 [Priceomyces carsonii]|uniref:uncharacterized protein n=1 Tax=Priceomyces carsonii TaxID=28549 RepID=UPI002ED9DE18|nr:unnamed protein product [Priceomyces carsonii]
MQPQQTTFIPNNGVDSSVQRDSLSHDSKQNEKLADGSFSDDTEHSRSITNEEKSIGVRKAEILALQWDKWYYKLILLFSAFLVGYAYGLDGNVRYVFTGYATQSYAEHTLLSTVDVITAVAMAAAQPVYARLSDVFGRLEIFLVAVMFYVVGTIIESQAKDVQRYAGGAILYLIGYCGAIITVMFIMADFSSLKWRLFFLLTPTFPFIINTWISGNVTGAVGMRWSWGVGMWAFIFPLACIPLTLCMIHMRYLAGKTEEWKQFKMRKTKYQELGLWGFLKHLFWMLDIIGLLLLIACLGCILVPLTLAGGVKSTWKHGNIIAPIVIGAVLVPVFVLWEGYGSKHPIAPLHLLKDRGIWAGLLISLLLNFISAVESSYLYTVLMVAINESQTSATRITSLSSFVGVVAGVFYGLFVVKFRKLKGFIIFGCAMWMVALGILFHFRSGTDSHAGVIGGVCLMGFGTTFFSYPVEVSMQSCTSHEHMAVIISFAMTVYRIGAAVGSSVAGAVWSQTLYLKLLKEIKNEKLALYAYTEPYNFIVEYTWGTPARDGMVEAYRYIQRILIMIALIFCVPMIFSGLFLRDKELTNEQSIEEVEKANKDESFSMLKLFEFNLFKRKRSSKETSDIHF